jgi:hypothetical protein
MCEPPRALLTCRELIGHSVVHKSVDLITRQTCGPGGSRVSVELVARTPDGPYGEDHDFPLAVGERGVLPLGVLPVPEGFGDFRALEKRVERADQRSVRRLHDETFALCPGNGLSDEAIEQLELGAGECWALGSLVNTALPVLGIGLGAMIAGVLVQYGPHPTLLIFVILMALFVVLAFATGLLPETVQRVPGSAAALRPRVAVPPRGRRAFAGAVPTMVSGWALNGLTLSLGASLLGTVFQRSNHGVIGLVIGLFTLSAAASSVLERNTSPWTMARLGSAAIAVGAILFVLALAWTSISLFVFASIVGGGGFGTGYLGSIRSVSQLAEIHERAALISAVYVVGYLAFSIPALVTGILANRNGLPATSLAYGGFVAIVAIGALAVGGVSVQREQNAA